MSLADEFSKFITEEKLFAQNDKLLLAVSGGVDSVVLCELCKIAGYDFAIAHCNFQLRDEESTRDEKFVQSLAEHYQVKFFVKIFDTTLYSEQRKVSVQVAARELRYQWFDKVLTELQRTASPGSRSFILTAHHANDNIETVMMNFFKGTGVHGLRGILPKHGNLIRPLLFATKQQLIEFASAGSLQFVEDSSNSSDKYTRNYFRNQLIPSLHKIYPEVENNIASNISKFRDVEIIYDNAISLFRKKSIVVKGVEVHIPALKLLKTPGASSILYEIIKEYGFTSLQVHDAVSLLTAHSGKFIISSTHRLLKDRAWLIITPLDTQSGDNIIIDKDGEYVYPGGTLKLQIKSNAEIDTAPDVAWIDASLIVYPILLRRWKQGDFFYPLGMTKKKKLSRFFIDQKMTVAEKERTWVVEMDKKIIWVVGKRIDNRFRVTTATTTVLRINNS